MRWSHTCHSQTILPPLGRVGSTSMKYSGKSCWSRIMRGSKPAARHSSYDFFSTASIRMLPLGSGLTSWCERYWSVEYSNSQTRLPSQSNSSSRPPSPPRVKPLFLVKQQCKQMPVLQQIDRLAGLVLALPGVHGAPLVVHQVDQGMVLGREERVAREGLRRVAEQPDGLARPGPDRGACRWRLSPGAFRPAGRTLAAAVSGRGPRRLASGLAAAAGRLHERLPAASPRG